MAWKIHIEDSFQFEGPSLRAAKRGDGESHVVTNMTMEPVKEGAIGPPNPMLHGPDATAFLQAAMDAAYEYGLRPSNAVDERHLQAHLEDMRAIAKHTLKMPIS